MSIIRGHFYTFNKLAYTVKPKFKWPKIYIVSVADSRQTSQAWFAFQFDLQHDATASVPYRFQIVILWHGHWPRWRVNFHHSRYHAADAVVDTWMLIKYFFVSLEDINDYWFLLFLFSTFGEFLTIVLIVLGPFFFSCFVCL